jgi:putative pyruvate formate lyase activating enzyme
MKFLKLPNIPYWRDVLMNTNLSNCTLCPRNCGINRNTGLIGYCGAGSTMKVAKIMLHQWEEPCISGSKGSGAVFFSNCNLKCIYCQNHLISQKGIGNDMSVSSLCDNLLSLQKQGAHNINLVTPTHYVPQIIEAVLLAKSQGLILPIIYNCSGYENLETIKLLKGIVDVYLPDIKYSSDKYAVKYSNAPNYFNHAKIAIEEMFNQVGKAEFDECGIIKKGMIIRHLMLPGLLFDSKKIMDYIYSTFGDSVFISIMNQYTPVNKAHEFVELSKPLNPKHYDSLIDYALSIGIQNAFIQDSGTSSEAFIPDFK